MIIRIVKMTFRVGEEDNFLKVFEENSSKIRGFEGCTKVDLLRDKNQQTIFFTYSYWNDEHYLENYRNSELFKVVWSKTKVLFAAKAEAWSLEKLEF